jgi:hypothetical protein
LIFDRAELLNQLLQAFVLFAVAVLPVGALYIITLLRHLIRDTNRRAESNRLRDAQRAEIAKNVQQLINGDGVSRDNEKATKKATATKTAVNARRRAKPARQRAARVVSVRTDDAAPTEPRSGQKDDT